MCQAYAWLIKGNFIMSEVLKEKIKQKKAKIGIIGLGYVGLPWLLNTPERIQCSWH
jgi:hypothetical protein